MNKWRVKNERRHKDRTHEKLADYIGTKDIRLCITGCEREFCGGGSFHSLDFDKNEQRVCFKGILFE